MKATVDKSLCVGCGVCVDICPEVFEMDDDEGVAIAKINPVPPEVADSCREAADQCPQTGIQIDEPNG
jgi:ferredoxin